ncbi:MAG: ATP-binding protein [Deferribacteres bacterium]|nr:ATP-binding protein [candidate division KSB1 bacterium]MCB9501952.1 ATP-binding protein [Deferribacteres bacterium]
MSKNFKNDEELTVRVVSDEEIHMSMLAVGKLIKPIREQLYEFASGRGFSDDQIYEIQLAVNEALANIIKHGYKGEKRGEIELSAETNRFGDLEIAIQDFAEKVDLAKLVSRDLEDVQDSGLGVYLINNLMDEVEYDLSREKGTRLILKKKLKQE